MHSLQDTIAAIATPPGKGGIGIIRVSGQQTPAILSTLFGLIPPPRQAQLAAVYDDDGAVLDRGLILYFEMPHSYTGEHVFEWQGHGGPVILNMILKRILKQGARLAQPGEFTERAFLNDKIDLAQAEAVADLIESSSEQAARAAIRNLEGEFSKAIDDLQSRLIYTRSYIEAALDFPEEEIDFLSDQQLKQAMQALIQAMQQIQASSQRGRVLKEGLNVVILGCPNAGKSSLLNRLAQNDAAIVTDIPGTTRDILHEHIHLDGIPLHIIDTAGLRSSPDTIEQQGIQKAWQMAGTADRVLLLVDDSKGLSDEDRATIKQLSRNTSFDIILNKIDISKRLPGLSTSDGVTTLALSVKTGEGLGLLVDHLKTVAGFRQAGENAFIARQRHIEALALVKQHIDEAGAQLEYKAGELAAESLKQAQHALSTIVGEFSNDDLLGEIFSSFCIDK